MVGFKPVSPHPHPPTQDCGILSPHHCQVRTEKQLHKEERGGPSPSARVASELRDRRPLAKPFQPVPDPSAPPPNLSSCPQWTCHSRGGKPRSQRSQVTLAGSRMAVPALGKSPVPRKSTLIAVPHRAGEMIHGRRGSR